MSLPTFFRGSLPDLWVSLAPDAVLSPFVGGWLVQDPFGVGNYVSLLRVSSGNRVPVRMVTWGDGEAGTNFGGSAAMSLLAAGEYSIQGSVRDESGNLTAFALGFVLVDGAAPENGMRVVLPGASSVPGASFPLPGPVIVAMLRPGARATFPDLTPLVAFSSPTTNLEFP